MIGADNELVRDLWLRKVLAEIPQGKRILDAGAGELANKKYCQHLDYVSQDICQYEGTGDSRGLQMSTWDTSQIDIVCDIEDIPEESESFDAILCSEVLEHLPNPVNALNELNRLLRGGGGILIITAPFCSLTHFAPYHYSTGFNRYFYEYHLPRLGLEISEITANGNFFEYLGQELRRTLSVNAQYSSRKISILEKLVMRFTMKILLNRLQKFSDNDTNSKELLCYGYHVVAKKK